jgi:hypothetical protein
MEAGSGKEGGVAERRSTLKVQEVRQPSAANLKKFASTCGNSDANLGIGASVGMRGKVFRFGTAMTAGILGAFTVS